MQKVSWIDAVALVWLAAATSLIWLAASAAGEPPVWDSMSYLQKAQAFWSAVSAGAPFNPFNLEPTVRPPGTVLMSYPFGFDLDFRGYYFRSVFVPLVLLVASVYLAVDGRSLTPAGRVARAGLALAAGGLPMLYQFQINDALPVADTWGRVDNFMAGVAALAAALLLRGMARMSAAWIGLAGFCAALCLTIKPAGAVVMAALFLAWLWLLLARVAFSPAALWADPALRRLATRSFGVCAVIYFALGVAAYASDYFSSDNLAFGSSAIAVMRQSFPAWAGPAFLWYLIRVSLGVVIPACVAAGLVTALAERRLWGHALSVLSVLACGLFFWISVAGFGEIRYFVPFAAMAFVLAAPALVDGFQRRSAALAVAAALIVAAPALFITLLLGLRAPPPAWQALASVNVSVDAYPDQRAQALELIADLAAARKTSADLYLVGLTSPFRAVVATLEYERLLRPAAPTLYSRIPINWQRPHTYTLDDIATSDFVAFIPVADPAAELAMVSVDTFEDEGRVIQAWLTGAGAAEGVSTFSERGVRILRVDDPARLAQGLAALRARHAWSARFEAANPPMWFSPADVPGPGGAVSFATQDGSGDGFVIRGAAARTLPGGAFEIDLWAEARGPLGTPWTLFVHVRNQAGDIIANSEAELRGRDGPRPEAMIRRYTFRYVQRPAGAASLAAGIFEKTPEGLRMMTAQNGETDWNATRAIYPLP